jgi:hypothetical protein
MRTETLKIKHMGRHVKIMVGRKRKQGKRERNGRVQRERTIDPRAIAASMPHRAWLPSDKRHDQKAENPFGSLHLIGAITDQQYDAGIKYRDDVKRYRAVIDSPSHSPRALSLDGIAAGPPGYRISDDEAIRRRNAYARAFESVTGYFPRIVLKSVVIYDKALQSGDLPFLCGALNDLALHYGLTGSTNRRIGQK